jgi:ubiquinone/menaquinone biosynthesis C-methylase UbiE
MAFPTSSFVPSPRPSPKARPMAVPDWVLCLKMVEARDPLMPAQTPISIAAEPNRRLLQTEEPQAAEGWDTLLQYQVDFALPQELQLLLALDAWRRAANVLDVGCGNGYYLSKLQDFFPDKHYAGIDLSPELIARATKRHSGIRFSAADLTAYVSCQRFDILLMRFFIQHVRDFAAALRAADRLLEPEGRLIIIETDLARSSHYPPLPVFTEMLVTYAKVSAAHGSVKQPLLDHASGIVAATDPRWTVEHEEGLICPHLGPFEKSRLLSIYRLWVDLCDRSAMFAFPYDNVRAELETWAARETGFSSVALRVFVLRRDAPG